jgi:hypothetical protein
MFKKNKPPVDQWTPKTQTHGNPINRKHPGHHNEFQHLNMMFSFFPQFPYKAIIMQVIQKIRKCKWK